MSGSLSPENVAPTTTVALPAVAIDARAAAVPIMLGLARQRVVVSLDSLPPNLDLGSLGTIFVDNTLNSAAVTLTFPDTQMSNTIPANSAVYILAITGGKRFQIFSPVLVNTALVVLVLNKLVDPTGVQPIAGTIVISAGSITVANPGPVGGLPVTKSINAGVAANTPLAAANVARQFLLFQMPQTSDGWVNFNGGAAAPNAADSFYMQAGEKYLSTGYVPRGLVSVYITLGGEVPCIEG